MDFRTSAVLLWSFLVFSQLLPALYLLRKKRHFLLATFCLGTFCLLSWQKVLWVFWVDVPLDKEAWSAATLVLLLCVLLILVLYSVLQALKPLPVRASTSITQKKSTPLLTAVLLLSFLPEFSTSFRESVFFLPYLCLQSAVLAQVLFRGNSFLVAAGLVALVYGTFLATGSLSLGVQVFEIVFLVGLLKGTKKYWFTLAFFVLVLSILQTAKAAYRAQLVREQSATFLEKAYSLWKGVEVGWAKEEEKPSVLSPETFTTYYGFGAGAIQPYYTSKGVLPWACFHCEILFSFITREKFKKTYLSEESCRGLLRDVLGMRLQQPQTLLSVPIASGISNGFSRWNSRFLYPLFQKSLNSFYTRGDSAFPKSPLFHLDLFPRQEWNDGIFLLTRGLLRLGDDTLDRVLGYSPHRVPFKGGETYSLLREPTQRRAFYNVFGREFGYLAFWDKQTTVTFNQFTEAYLNFGFWGLLFSSFLWAGLLYGGEFFVSHLSSRIREVALICFAKAVFLPKEASIVFLSLLFTALGACVVQLLLFLGDKNLRIEDRNITSPPNVSAK